MASGPITSWEIDGETVETVSDFIFWGSKITADGDCSHEIKRRLLLGRKVMTNLDSIFKSRDITLPEGWYGEGGGRRVQDGEHMYTCGRSMSMYFFALITEEGFLISSCCSLELCIQTLISFPCSFAFRFSSFHSYL